MLLEFKPTIEDMAHLVIRQQQRLPSVRGALLKGRLIICFFMGCFVYLVVHELWYAERNLGFPSESFNAIERTVVFGLGFLVGYIILFVFHQFSRFRYFKKVSAEIYSEYCKHPFLIELRPDCLFWRWDKTTSMIPWNQVKEIGESGTGIELATPGGLVAVPNWVFLSTEEKALFLETARHFCEQFGAEEPAALNETRIRSKEGFPQF